MNFLKVIVLSFTVLLVNGCASTQKEVPTDKLSQDANIVRLSGEVFNIREVKKDASLSKQMGGSLVGALVGGQFGGGSMSTVLGTSGAFIGQDIVNDKYGEVVDRLILKDEKGNEYNCLVHGHDFKVGDAIVFTLVENHVSAIIHSTK